MTLRRCQVKTESVAEKRKANRIGMSSPAGDIVCMGREQAYWRGEIKKTFINEDYNAGLEIGQPGPPAARPRSGRGTFPRTLGRGNEIIALFAIWGIEGAALGIIKVTIQSFPTGA